MIAIVFVACLGIFLQFLTLFLDWRMLCREAAFKLRYNNFVQYYSINPDRYSFYNYPRQVCVKTATIGFSYIDYIRFRIWYKNKSKSKDKTEKNKKLEWYLQLVLADIQKAKQEASQMQADAIQELLNRSGDIKLE